MRVRFFQDGGAATEGQSGGNPIEQLVSMAAQALQSNDGNMALQVCQGLIQLAQGGAQGGAPAGGAPEEEAPEEGEPVYRRGGRLVRRIYY